MHPFPPDPAALAYGQAAGDVENDTSNQYLYDGEGRLCAVRDILTGAMTAYIYRLLDHEGSLVATTDGSGNVTGTNLLSPYGEVLSSNTNDPYSYAGLYQDTEYGGNAATYRNYSTEQLRWLRPDPYNGSYDLSNPQSFNRYMYLNGNPLAYTDPSGLDVIPWWFFYNGGGDGASGGASLSSGLGAAAAGSSWVPVVGEVLAGALAVAELGKLFGWWGGGPQFTGNVRASQTGKIVPSAAPNNGRNCRPNPASAGQSGPVQEVLNSYYMTGQTSGLYTFGGPGVMSAGFNSVAQFVGSFRWSISGGNLSLTNTTSFRSLTYDMGPQWQRGSFPTPMGNTHQTYNISVTCQ